MSVNTSRYVSYYNDLLRFCQGAVNNCLPCADKLYSLDVVWRAISYNLIRIMSMKHVSPSPENILKTAQVLFSLTAINMHASASRMKDEQWHFVFILRYPFTLCSNDFLKRRILIWIRHILQTFVSRFTCFFTFLCFPRNVRWTL